MGFRAFGVGGLGCSGFWFRVSGLGFAGFRGLFGVCGFYWFGVLGVGV